MVLQYTQYASNNNKYVNDDEEAAAGTNPQSNTASVGNKDVIYDQNKGGYLPKYAVLDDAIASQGFYNDRTLTDYKVPGGTRRIGDFAYARSSMTSLTIPQGVTSIGYGAFYHCDSLADVSIPSTVTEIEPYAFSNTPFLNNFLSARSVCITLSYLPIKSTFSILGRIFILEFTTLLLSLTDNVPP